MTDDTEDQTYITGELEQANARLPVDFDGAQMPLDITIRSIALTVAQRHCGDTTVKEGSLYQQLKMDNKLAGPLTVNDVIHCALIFERFMWGEWSKGIAGDALANTMEEMDAILEKEWDEKTKDLNEEPPTRPHSGA